MDKKTLLRVFTAVGMLALGTATSALGQVTTGALIGSVTDPTGLALARVEVRVADESHGVVRTAATDNFGLYRFVDLPPASYTVTAAATGFRPVTRGDVPVPVASTVRIDFQLSLAAITQTVEVTARIRPIQTTSGELGTVLDQRRIESLPLNGRHFLQLALLTPGVEGPVDN